MTEAARETAARGTALVTGAGSGLGAAIAKALAADGYTIACAGRRLDRVQQVADEIRGRSGSALAVRLDVRDSELVDEVVAGLARDLGRLDVLINNAGVFRKGVVRELSDEAWGETIGANLTGAFYCARAAVTQMLRQDPVRGARGQIVNINSGAGLRGYPTGSAYSAAKFGLLGLSDTLRGELNGHLVKVTDVVVATGVESELSNRKDLTRLPAEVVGQLVASVIALAGRATVTRVDLGQLDA